MAFTAKDVAKLREQTGAGMMDCKKALTHTDGDMEKAAEYLREQGVNIAAKKASRIASEGVVYTGVSNDAKTGAMVEINCESDFVSASATFVELCKSVCEAIISSKAETVEELLTVKTAEGTVLELVNNATAKIGEKISIRRFVKFSTKSGMIDGYIHMGGKIGVLVEVGTDKNLNSDAEFKAMCHDIALHIAAFVPKYVKESEVPDEEVAHEKEILTAQALNEGKPAAVVEKMIGGRIKKFFAGVCLLNQEFVKDNSKTVSQVVAETAKNLGAKIEVVQFKYFLMGEGLEKKNENFAEEIAKLQK